MSLKKVFLIIAVVLFALAAFGVGVLGISFGWAGAAFLAASFLVD